MNNKKIPSYGHVCSNRDCLPMKDHGYCTVYDCQYNGPEQYEPYPVTVVRSNYRPPSLEEIGKEYGYNPISRFDGPPMGPSRED